MRCVNGLKAAASRPTEERAIATGSVVVQNPRPRIWPSHSERFIYNGRTKGVFTNQRTMDMNRGFVEFLIAAGLACLLLTGCVERELTINTEPQGALVALNDEQIGVSPVTVAFNWYGDYNVRAGKEGYETLETHRELKAPLHDWPGLDFIAQVLYPGRIVDSYEWTFELAPRQDPTREELIEKADALRSHLQ